MTRDAVAAQRTLLAWAEDDIDALVGDVAGRIADHAEELARATVEETGIGNVADKAVKNRFASRDVAASMIGRPGVGASEMDRTRGILQIADPVGVVVGLMPVTNPVATTVFKSLCIGMGNGLAPSLTLGCGTYGNTSTTDNITYTHLLNVKRLVSPTPAPVSCTAGV